MKIWIVGDVLHSRVARSCLLAFQLMGAEVTLCGPPTLIPRGIEALGPKIAYDLDGLAGADVVYALRMQRERMSESFVPSLREYAARYQIDSRRLGPRQLLMHPGPVNRGVELAPEVIDSPQSLITAQVESGLVVRMAIIYELLTGRDGPRAAKSASPADHLDDRAAGMNVAANGSSGSPEVAAAGGAAGAGGEPGDPRRAPVRSSHRPGRDPGPGGPRRRDRGVGGARRRPRGRGSRGGRGRGAARPAGVRRSPRPPPGARARSTRRTWRRVPARRRRAATAR